MGSMAQKSGLEEEIFGVLERAMLCTVEGEKATHTIVWGGGRGRERKGIGGWSGGRRKGESRQTKILCRWRKMLR
jgi:hypothetical protein